MEWRIVPIKLGNCINSNKYGRADSFSVIGERVVLINDFKQSVIIILCHIVILH